MFVDLIANKFKEIFIVEDAAPFGEKVVGLYDEFLIAHPNAKLSSTRSPRRADMAGKRSDRA